MMFSSADWFDIRVLLWIGVVAIGLGWQNNALAQVIADDTLGAESSIVNNAVIRGLPSDLIEGGATRGQNLFHSFSQFDVEAGRGAYFSNPAGIENIFSRVTVENPSEIMGALGIIRQEITNTLGTANLFFVNPNGILFGPNARLDLGGSFVVTTAESVQFDNQLFSSVTNLTVLPELLQINPSAFLFGGFPDNITNQSRVSNFVNSSLIPEFAEGLRVPDGKNLILLGGDINLDGGSLTAMDGHIQLGSIASNGYINIDSQSELIIPPNDIPRGDITLSDNSIVNTQGTVGGSIDVFARNLNLFNQSGINTSLIEDTDPAYTQVGNITLNASNQILIQNSVIANNVASGTTGNTGKISIQARSLLVNGSLDIARLRAIITNSSFGLGNAGEVVINADSVEINQGEIFNRIPEGSNGNGGTLTINAEIISLSGAFITTANRGNGNGGAIRLYADSVTATNGTQLTSSIFGQGNSGEVIINARREVNFDGFRIDDQGTTLRTAIFSNVERNGNGRAGDIKITADSITFANQAALYSNIRALGQGRSGDIYITGNSLLVSNLAEINSNVLGEGIGGNIFINVDGDVSFRGGDAFSNLSGRLSESIAGDVIIESHNLYLSNSGQINTISRGQGDSGNIIINTLNNITIDGASESPYGTGLFTAAVDLGSYSNGGHIGITTNSLHVSNGGILQTRAAARGTSGDILINASGPVVFSGERELDLGPISYFLPSTVTASAQNNSTGSGDILIHADSLYVTDGAEITSESILGSRGNGGNIIVDIANDVLVDGFGVDGSSSSISSSSGTWGLGAGGSVNINANTVEVSNGGLISAQTDLLGTRGGDITIDALRFEAINGGQLLTTTNGFGQAGNITLNIQSNVKVAGQDPNFNQRAEGFVDTVGANSGLFASTTDISRGDGGSILIFSPVIFLRESGTISAQSEGTGAAGNVNIEASNLFRVNDGDIITAATSASGGSILINVSPNSSSGILVLEGDSDITTNSRGDGGNIIIGGTIVALDDSDILARSQDARGGNITLGSLFSETFPPDNQPPFDGDGQVDINADGQIAAGTITTPDTSFIQNSLSELPEILKNPETLVANSCIARSQAVGGTFIITGGNLSERPEDAIASTYPTGTVRTIAETYENQAFWQLGDPIIEPEAVYRLADGRLVMSRECS